MQAKLAPYAPYVFWAGVMVLALTIIVAVGGGRGPIQTEYMAIGGIVLIALGGLMNPAAVQRLIGTRTVRYGGNALIITVAFLAILGLVNYVGTRPRFNWRQDFTANQQFSLSPQTIQILTTLKEPVKATAFFSLEAFGRREAEDRLREYKLRSQGKFDYEFVDPIERPDLARQLGVTRDGGIVFQLGSKKQEAISTSESDFTGALIKLTTDKPRAVHFITGHKERDIGDFSENGYSTLRQWLEKDNYTVATLNTFLTTTIPSTATMLILASPTITLADAEIAALNWYLDGGGRMLILSDPLAPNPLPGVLQKWGIQFNNDVAVEPGQNYQSPLVPVLVDYPFSVITQKLTNRPTIFPVTRSIKRGEGASPNITAQAIAQTTALGWGETSLEPLQLRFEEGKDHKGPVDLMVTVEGNSGAPGITTTAKTRLVVVGTSQLVSNKSLQDPRIANIDLFMNAINWLAEEEALISIRPTPPDTRSVFMTDGQLRLVALITILVIPGVTLLTGVGIWWRRR
jgi:ABC-type uncharacterized transport system involved in gliding motility auxiliary subunit